jgi:hypothetical protein
VTRGPGELGRPGRRVGFIGNVAVQVPSEMDNPPSELDWRPFCLLLGVVGVMLVGLGFFWLSYCTPAVGVGCLYLDGGYGLLALLAGLFLLVLAGAALVPRASKSPLAADAAPGASSPALVGADAAPSVTAPTRCQYCGAITGPPARLCRRCRRPLAWSNPA